MVLESDDAAYTASIGLSLMWTAFAIACICCTLRYVAQRTRHGKLHVEDWLNLAALACCFVYNLCATTTFVGRTIEIFTQDLSDNFKASQFDVFALWLGLYFVTLWLCKLSFLFVYKRIFWVSRRFRWFWWSALVFCVIWFFIGLLSQFWYCQNDPAKYYWSSAECQKTDEYPLPIAIVSILSSSLTDIFIAALPLGMIFKLQMSRAHKVRLAVVFVLGLVTILIDITSWIFDAYAANAPAKEYVVFSTGIEPSVVISLTTLPIIVYFRTAPRRLYQAGVSNTDEKTKRATPMASERTKFGSQGTSTLKDGTEVDNVAMEQGEDGYTHSRYITI